MNSKYLDEKERKNLKNDVDRGLEHTPLSRQKKKGKMLRKTQQAVDVNESYNE